MTRSFPRAALVVTTATALVVNLSACQAPDHAPAPRAATISPDAAGAVYVTGAKAGDDPCARVVSAIGYLGLSLLPAGQEEAQHWDGDVRGRFGYLRGTMAMYGPRLPAPAAPAVAAVDGLAGTLSLARTADSRRPRLLREYRTASAAVLTACGRPSPGRRAPG
ncbi:hypothetical protein OG320_26225 [Microbispora sp. NBC_01189]|uniref:hypothetical protein n=1 Tax=Microbispora sp. NBC_01189 TaxID=2903583 RepID=UPI002E126CB1|nr:hypothetical protein OG320_26225 [Microbispora sp. NBC_01189]